MESRFCQITDLHIGLPSFSPSLDSGGVFPADFETVLRRLEESGISILALTGDLLDIPAEILVAAPADPGLTEKLGVGSLSVYNEIKRLLDRHIPHHIALPGNHDHPPAFYSVFGKARVLDAGGLRFTAFHDSEMPDHVPERTGPERARFEKSLQDDSGIFQVHLQHFCVHRVDNSAYPYNYREHVLLQEKIGRSRRVIACLCGHYHPGTPLEKQGAAYFSACPAFAGETRPYRVFAFTGDDLLMEECSGRAR